MKELDILWLVVSAIQEAHEIAGAGRSCRTVAATFKGVSAKEVANTFERLADNDKVIRLISMPSVANPRASYEYEVLSAFDGYYLRLSRTHALKDLNALKVWDVALDIDEQLNMASGTTVKIEAAPHRVKRPKLLPYDSIPTRAAYMKGRRQACAFLKDIGAILEYSAPGAYTDISITVQHSAFTTVLDVLQSRFAIERPATPASTRAELTYDKKRSALQYGEKSLPIADGTIMHYICEFVFSEVGEKIDEQDIIDRYGKTVKKRGVYQAYLRLNKLVDKTFGLEKTFGYGNEKVWLNTLQAKS